MSRINERINSFDSEFSLKPLLTIAYENEPRKDLGVN
jgi:hypothetical protein